MKAEIVDRINDCFIGKEEDGYYSLYDENGETVSYEEAPKIAKSKYDWLELKRQGQQEIKFSK